MIKVKFIQYPESVIKVKSSTKSSDGMILPLCVLAVLLQPSFSEDKSEYNQLRAAISVLQQNYEDLQLQFHREIVAKEQRIKQLETRIGLLEGTLKQNDNGNDKVTQVSAMERNKKVTKLLKT